MLAGKGRNDDSPTIPWVRGHRRDNRWSRRCWEQRRGSQRRAVGACPGITDRTPSSCSSLAVQTSPSAPAFPATTNAPAKSSTSPAPSTARSSRYA